MEKVAEQITGMLKVPFGISLPTETYTFLVYGTVVFCIIMAVILWIAYGVKCKRVNYLKLKRELRRRERKDAQKYREAEALTRVVKDRKAMSTQSGSGDGV